MATDPNRKLTREGLIARLFDAFAHTVPSDKDSMLDLLSEVAEAVDGRREQRKRPVRRLSAEERDKRAAERVKRLPS